MSHCKFMGWSWHEYMATPRDVLDVVNLMVVEENERIAQRERDMQAMRTRGRR